VIHDEKKPVSFGQRARTANVICVREYFPDTYAAAVRQKSRWITGIVFQGFKTHRWSDSAILNYFLWRDRKGAIANFLSFAAMLVMLQLVALLIYQHAVEDAWQFLSIFIGGAWLTTLLWVNFFLMVNRIAQRIIFVTAYYGLLQGLMAIPRLFWGNLINWRAIRQVVRHGDPHRVAWDKTTHDFPTVTINRILRPLGQILVESGVITTADLEDVLSNRTPGLKLGGCMVQRGLISPLQLAQALAEQGHVPAQPVDFRKLNPELIHSVPAKIALHYAILPLRVADGTLIFASESAIDPVSLAALSRKVKSKVGYVIVPRGQVVVGLRYWYGQQQIQHKRRLLERTVAAGFLTQSQANNLWDEYVAGQIFFAEVLVSENKLDEAVLRAVLLRYERSDMLFGEFLVQQGVVGQQTVNEALARQQKLQPSLQGLLQKAGISSLQLACLMEGKP